MKLLIVDDSKLMRNIIEDFLEEEDFTIVGSAPDGETALEIFKNALPDVVTMDVTMPKMDGITCLTEMLKIKSDAKILMLASQADKVTSNEVIGRGAAGILCKPFSAEKLIDKIKEITG